MLNCIHASRITDNIYQHNVGVYFQNIPVDCYTGLSSIDYKKADELGYVKFDIINNNVYQNIKDNVHMEKLLNMEPVWEMLDFPEVVEKLYHINNHFDIVSKLKPDSVEKLAAVLCMIRPAKRYLITENPDWDYIFEYVWTPPEDKTQYYFKKSHSIAYAKVIVLQMNLIYEELINEGHIN